MATVTLSMRNKIIAMVFFVSGRYLKLISGHIHYQILTSLIRGFQMSSLTPDAFSLEFVFPTEMNISSVHCNSLFGGAW